MKCKNVCPSRAMNHNIITLLITEDVCLIYKRTYDFIHPISGKTQIESI